MKKKTSMSQKSSSEKRLKVSKLHSVYKGKIVSLQDVFPQWLLDAMKDALKGKEAKAKKQLKKFVESELAWVDKGRLIKILKDFTKELPEMELEYPQKKEEHIKGGFGDLQRYEGIPKEVIINGLKVEMEHTDNPLEALEIILDHIYEEGTDKKLLTYYDELKKAEGAIIRNMKLMKWKEGKVEELGYGDIMFIDKGTPWDEEAIKELVEEGRISENEKEKYLDDDYYKTIILKDAWGKEIKPHYELSWDEEEEKWIEI